MLDVLRVLKGGKTLADSLATHPQYFSNLYVNIVRAGEASGALGPVFLRLSEFERTRDDLRAYIISSMIYPILLMLVGLGSVLVMMNFVVPRFAQVFKDSHLRMPVPTQIMLEVSAFLQAYGPFIALGTAAVIAALIAYVRTPVGRLWWDSARFAPSGARRRAAQGGDLALRARHGNADDQQRTAGPEPRHRCGHPQ